MFKNNIQTVEEALEGTTLITYTINGDSYNELVKSGQVVKDFCAMSFRLAIEHPELVDNMKMLKQTTIPEVTTINPEDVKENVMNFIESFKRFEREKADFEKLAIQQSRGPIMNTALKIKDRIVNFVKSRLPQERGEDR